MRRNWWSAGIAGAGTSRSCCPHMPPSVPLGDFPRIPRIDAAAARDLPPHARALGVAAAGRDICFLSALYSKSGAWPVADSASGCLGAWQAASSPLTTCPFPFSGSLPVLRPSDRSDKVSERTDDVYYSPCPLRWLSCKIPSEFHSN
jgi:hypothetical protein